MTPYNTPKNTMKSITKIKKIYKRNKSIKELRYKRVAQYTEGVSRLRSNQFLYKPLVYYHVKNPITPHCENNRQDLEMNPNDYFRKKFFHKYRGTAGLIFYVGPCHSSRNIHMKPGEQTCAEVI